MATHLDRRLLTHQPVHEREVLCHIAAFPVKKFNIFLVNAKFTTFMQAMAVIEHHKQGSCGRGSAFFVRGSVLTRT